MRYSEEIIENVRTSNDIVDVIGSYVRLKKSGANYFGLCPFHSEKTGSFSVSPTKQMFYCFGCHEGGNVISFVMKYENYSFSEAVKYLADRVNITLPEEEQSDREKKEASLRARILEANKEMAVFYYKLLKSQAGKIGLDYFRKRKLTDETIRSFGLGFAGKGGTAGVDYLKSKGFDIEIIKEAGLCNISEKYGISDRFWNRVMFPIMDINNRVIGFGGRVLGQGEPKYINTKETKIFDKGRNMYGLNVARHSNKNYRIVCEGYIDVITMHQAGFTEAVASLGTALTSAQASLLYRYTKDVRLIYDSDEAGIKAALRAIPLCTDAGLVPKIVDLKPYKDPDEFINNEGPEEFQKRLDNAENAFFYELRMAERNYDLKDPEGRSDFLKMCAAKLSLIEDEIKRDSYLSSVAAKYVTNENTLKKAVINEAAKNESRRIVIGENPNDWIKDRADDDDGTISSEKYLLTWLSDENSIFEEVKKYIEPSDFTEGITKETAELLFEQLKSGRCDPASIMDRFEDEEAHRKVAQIFSTKLKAIESREEKNRALTDLVVRIKETSLKRQAQDTSQNEGESLLSKKIRIRNTMDKLKNLKIEL